MKYVKKHHTIHETFKKCQEEMQQWSGINKEITSLKIPSNTRWGAAVLMLESLLEGKEALQSAFIQQHLKLYCDIKKTVLDNDIFWSWVASILTLLKPLSGSVTWIEADDSFISEDPKIFANIKEIMTADSRILQTSAVLKSEYPIFLKAIERRKKFCCSQVHPVHFAANLLDPRCHGEKLSESELATALEFLTVFKEVGCSRSHWKPFRILS